jgi:peroxiredoxin
MTTPQHSMVTLRVGDIAPQFSLPAHPSGTISLNDFIGKKNVILAFYPKDDTGLHEGDVRLFGRSR